MLYYLHHFTALWSPFRIFRYITVRAFAGAGTSFLLCVLLGPWLIRVLRKLQIGQYERREDAPPLYELHRVKEGTPTMGGVLIVLSILGACLLWAVPGNTFVLLALATLGYMALVGLWDDYTKVRRRDAHGLTARRKLLLQLVWAGALAAALMANPETAERARRLMIPFLKRPLIVDMGLVLTVLFIALVLVGATNAVNLTDGLDGLAIGCTGSVALSYLFMAYVAGHSEFADYLQVPFVPGAGELAVFCGCMLGAALGFLWHNCHPARIFMGDTGSLALGGAIAVVVLCVKQELTLIIVGGVFVMEALSVIIQVAAFKLTGRRVFAMAPIHHHFELRGWSETQVTIRFWVLSIIFALLGILTLKIR